MMISPESYREQNLKGKSKEEILKQIKELRKEINELIRLEEDPNAEPSMMMPGRRTIISCDRQYLEQAIEAYKEAGGIYTTSEQERREQDFNNSLDHLGCVKLIIEGYSYGMNTWICTFDGDDVQVSYMDHLCSVDPRHSNQNKYHISKAEFFSTIKGLHITDWKHHYKDRELLVMDGEEWTLEFFCHGPEKTRRYSGSSLYPYNFDELANLLRIDWE